MERTSKDVGEYLDWVPGQRGEEMRQLDRSITERMPDAGRHLYEGKFWGGSEQEIVGYGVMDYTNRSGDAVEWFTVGLAAQKNYISIYVNAVENDAYLLGQYKGKLGKVKMGSASISFDSLDDVDYESLMGLVERAGRLGS